VKFAPEEARARRQALRDRLIAAREAMPAGRCRAANAAIEGSLERLLNGLAPEVVGFCWPFRGEFDCRPLIARWVRGGTGRTAALPVIVATAAPMVFREWTPDSLMAEGRFGIPIPADGSTVVPELLLMPLNAFDNQGYRLGYGGGYFDRTLASQRPAPTSVGVGYELARVDSISPDTHDVPLDYVVTEGGLFIRRAGGLEHLD